MSQLGPWRGQRRGWLVVAAFLVFGVCGGELGTALTSSPVRPVPAVMVPAVESVPSMKPALPTAALTVPPVLVRPLPSLVVSTHEVVKVVKVYVSATPSSSPKPPQKIYTPKPTPTSAPSTRETTESAPAPTLTLPAAITPTPTPSDSSASPTPSGTHS